MKSAIKKKWSKVKNKEKSNNQIYIEKSLYQKIIDELNKEKFVSFTSLSSKYRIKISLIKKIINHLSVRKNLYTTKLFNNFIVTNKDL
ncbi:40S ribosomal protein S25 (nucleomorph) [Guillardia theta]|uniref:40S ribosomal protein S25 n=1 Tax=Guillardia theta TaxID=55529 RepID=Q98RQ8_GUITH|nr:40S ribosomal protein S25 [Guillardia theta]AAK39889.1 40S ribosomal protein S25 [Guillardia theta]